MSPATWLRRKPAGQWRSGDRLNFWLTNRIPRNLLTTWMGWYSRIESPWLARASIRLWQLFVDDLRLDEAETREFPSLHACFVRRLKPATRPIDPTPNVLVSPCDAEVGQFGRIEAGRLFQAKGMDYTLEELLGDPHRAKQYGEGWYVTLRLKSSMYHHFHAPDDARLRRIDYISGELFNVNPPTLRCLAGVFRRNERAVLPLELDRGGAVVTLVAVAAILVGSIRLCGLAEPLRGPGASQSLIECDLAFRRGQEMGWFEHGSTIIVLARSGLKPGPSLATGRIIRMGQALLVRDDLSADS